MTPQLTVTMRFRFSPRQSGADVGISGSPARAAAEQARAAADQQRENAIKDAQRATEGAGQPATAPLPPGERPIVFNTGNGEPVGVTMQGGVITLTQSGAVQSFPVRDFIPREATQIAWAIPATLSILLIWWPISRAVIRWLNRKHVSNAESAALEARLRERMDTLERNLDTVAIEMERVAEGQRFTNRLLAERPVPVPVVVPQGVPVSTHRS
ncbi:MAG: hypothetical protein ACOVSI_01355 [Gemmatimonas sp.]|jgi:hypothetical protein